VRGFTVRAAGVPATVVIVVLHAAGCGEAGDPGTVSAPTPLEQAFTLTGVVTEITANGRVSLANTDVVVRDNHPSTGGYRAFVRTDEQGRYVVRQVPRGTSLVVVADKFDCVQPAVAAAILDRETTVDVEVVCGPVKLAAQSPVLSGFLRDSRQVLPSPRWLYFDAACDLWFEASAITDREGFFQLSRLPLGRACLHSHGKVVEIDVRGDATLDLDVGTVP
jgi:hypothetical protein